MSEGRRLVTTTQAVDTAISGAQIDATDSQSCRMLPSPRITSSQKDKDVQTIQQEQPVVTAESPVEYRTCSSLSTVITTKGVKGVLPDGKTDNVQEDSIRFPDEFYGESVKLPEQEKVKVTMAIPDEVHSIPPYFQHPNPIVSLPMQNHRPVFDATPLVGSTRSQMSDNGGLMNLQGEELDSHKHTAVVGAPAALVMPPALAELEQHTNQEAVYVPVDHNQDQVNIGVEVVAGDCSQHEAQIMRAPEISVEHSGRSVEGQEQDLGEVAAIPSLQNQDNVYKSPSNHFESNVYTQADRNRPPTDNSFEDRVVFEGEVQLSKGKQQEIECKASDARTFSVSEKKGEADNGQDFGQIVKPGLSQQQNVVHQNMYTKEVVGEALAACTTNGLSRYLCLKKVGVLSENGYPKVKLTVQSDQINNNNNNNANNNTDSNINNNNNNNTTNSLSYQITPQQFQLEQCSRKCSAVLAEADSDKEHSQIAVANGSHRLMEDKNNDLKDSNAKELKDSRVAQIENLGPQSGWAGEELDSKIHTREQQSMQQIRKTVEVVQPEQWDFLEVQQAHVGEVKALIEQQSTVSLPNLVHNAFVAKECCSVEAQIDGEFDHLQPPRPPHEINMRSNSHANQFVANDRMGSPEAIQQSVQSQVENIDNTSGAFNTVVPASVPQGGHIECIPNNNNNSNGNNTIEHVDNVIINNNNSNNVVNESNYEMLTSNLQSILAQPGVPNSIITNILNLLNELSHNSYNQQVLQQVATALQAIAGALQNLAMYSTCCEENFQHSEGIDNDNSNYNCRISNSLPNLNKFTQNSNSNANRVVTNGYVSVFKQQVSTSQIGGSQKNNSFPVFNINPAYGGLYSYVEQLQQKQLNNSICFVQTPPSNSQKLQIPQVIKFSQLPLHKNPSWKIESKNQKRGRQQLGESELDIIKKQQKIDEQINNSNDNNSNLDKDKSDNKSDIDGDNDQQKQNSRYQIDNDDDINNNSNNNLHEQDNDDVNKDGFQKQTRIWCGRLRGVKRARKSAK